MQAIVIHGGAGTLPRSELTLARETAFRAGLKAALDAGYGVLEAGGSSLDAVTIAVRTLEDDPLFNAGRGAVLARDGRVELDASIMDGRHLRAGAVAGLRHVKNPIELARAIMERSPHVMLAGEGAEAFAQSQGLALVPNEYFVTPERQAQLERVLTGSRSALEELSGLGTVGAVALDREGNLAAATSTGGMTNKYNGRIGDSAIIGAGTYAENGRCAISATGHGEYFIRSTAAYDICARTKYLRSSLAAAARQVVRDKLGRMGGEGGIIGLDARGNVVMEFSTEGMFRAARTSRGDEVIAIHR